MNKPAALTVVKDLTMIADKIATIEKTVAKLKEHVPSDVDGHVDVLDKARRYYRSRRQRDSLFGKPSLFGEPAWDMLVDLFIAAEESKRISVSSLCVAAAVPMTTALRWITILETEGLLKRSADDSDARRYFLTLSDEAYAKMRRHFLHIGL